MVTILQYFLRVSVGLTCMYLFYAVVLKKFTFYGWNRAYFWTCSVLCLIMPFIDISKFFTHSEPSSTISFQQTIISGIPQVAINYTPVQEATRHISSTAIITILLISGMVAMLIKLSFALLSIYRLKQKSQILERRAGFTIYQVNGNITPFSFRDSIFLNKDLHETTELDKILAHEQVHVLQYHTLDNLWAEFLVIINWFNPFVWLLRRAVKENLEYIADAQVLERGINKQQYQYLLLHVSGIHQAGPTNAFNLSSLKNRIKMMNKTKTTKVQLLKFTFLLPLIVVLLFSFRAVANKAQGAIQFYGSILNGTNNQPMEAVTITDPANHIKVTTDKHGYYTFSFNNEKEVHYPIDLRIQKEGFKSAEIKMKSLIGKDGQLNALYMANAGLQPLDNAQPATTILIGAAQGTEQYRSLQKTRDRFTSATAMADHMEISGIVFDQASHTAISNATLKSAADKVIGHTDDKGFYSLVIDEKEIIGVKYYINFTKQGYQDFPFALSIDPAKQKEALHPYLLTNIGLSQTPIPKDGPFPSSYSTGQDKKVTYQDALAALDFKVKYDAIAEKVKATHKAIVKVDSAIWVISQNTTSRYTILDNLTISVDGKQMSVDEASKKLAPNDIGTVDMKNGRDLVITTIK